MGFSYSSEARRLRTNSCKGSLIRLLRVHNWQMSFDRQNVAISSFGELNMENKILKRWAKAVH